MTKLSMGYKAGYGPYVKIMKNDADDPVTTPNSQHGKFLFNSESEMAYVSGILTFSYGDIRGGYPANDVQFIPAGSNASNCLHIARVIRFSSGSHYAEGFWYLDRIFGNFGTNFAPWYEVRKLPSGTGGKIPGPSVDYQRTGHHGGGGTPETFTGQFIGLGGYFGDCAPTTSLSTWNPQTGAGFSYGGPLGKTFSGTEFGYSTSTVQLATVWDMPMNAEPLNRPTGTVVEGQEVLKITPTLVRMARVGFDANSATGRQCIIDSTRVPAKIVAAGEVSISAGTFHDVFPVIPVTLGPLTYCDYHVRHSATWLHPAHINTDPGEDESMKFNYRVFGDYVRLYNDSGRNLVVRYLILTDDKDVDLSSGGNKVLHVRNDGTKDYVQLKRPGSSDTAPTVDEIYLDSRLPYLPLVAEGYIPAGQFNETPTDVRYGNAAKTVSFANDGTWRPFLKFSLVYADGSRTRGEISQSRLLWTSAFGSGPGKAFRYRQSRNGSVAVVTNTSVKFHIAPGNPSWLDVNSSGSIVAVNDTPNPIGLRYYVFAIPNSL